MRRIKVYQPEDKITFGNYEGEDWRFLYAFEPDQIERLIRSNDWFAIDYEAFKDLHTAPIPKTLIGNEKYLTVDNKSIQVTEYIRTYLSSIKDYTDPPEEPNKHVFSERTLNVLQEKIEAWKSSVSPKREKTDWRAVISDYHFENRQNAKDDLGNPAYCGVCESAPCMCSNKGRTSETYDW